MRTILAAIATCLIAGCAAGGGPFVGYGLKHGLIYGAEVGGGIPVAQAAFGAQNRDLLGYLRLDVTGNTAGFERDGSTGYGGRLGAGYGWGRTHHGGVFAIGGNVGYAFRTAGCRENGIVGIAGVELRYAGGEPQLVAVSRVEGVREFCLD